MRIGFYIWTVRYFSSRSKATIACKNGDVTVNARRIKPSHEVLVNDIIEIKKNSYFDYEPNMEESSQWFQNKSS